MKKKNKICIVFSLAFGALLGAFPLAGQAADSVSFEAGYGNETRLLRLGAQWKWEKNWLDNDSSYLGGYWDLGLANWNGRKYRNEAGENQNINAIGIIPVVRWQSKSTHGIYIEAGVGPHILSELYDNNRRQLSTRFQFGSHLGLGYTFARGWEAGLRFQHYSNASIKRPNDGVNFLIGRVAYKF